MRLFLRLLRYFLVLALVGVVFGCLSLGVAYWLIAPRLPSVETLKEIRLQVPLRVYTADNRLIATFGETRRIPVPIDKIPTPVKQALDWPLNKAARAWSSGCPPPARCGRRCARR